MTTTRRTRTTTKVASAAAGLGLAAVAVLGFSNAAFLAKTDPSENNNWATDGIDDNGTPEDPGDDEVLVKLDFGERDTAPLFSFGLNGAAAPRDGTQALPLDGYLGDVRVANAVDTDGERDITVEYEGVVDADVRMYVVAGYDDPKDLDAHTDVVVKRDEATVWTGKLDAMPTSWGAAGATAWAAEASEPGDPDTATYSVHIKKDGSAPNAATIENVDFVWEAQQPGQ